MTTLPRGALLLVAATVVGCAHADTYRAEAPYGVSPSAPSYDSPPEMAMAGQSARDDGMNARRQLAQNMAATTAPSSPTSGVQPAAVTDASASHAMIIYTANVVLAIYEVDATQRRLVAAAEAVGGFVASLDAASIVLRVPSARFESFLETVEGTGRVLGRSIQADDITEQFRDLEIRLQNLMAMRERLEQMLARAANVQEALAVERELERITVELESLRGRLRFLSDRVSLSTITIQFQALPREQLTGDTPSAPPVPWLQSLGLGNLLQN